MLSTEIDTTYPLEYTAAVPGAPNQMTTKTFRTPKPETGEVLIKVDRAAVCGSDLHALYEGLGSLIARDEPLPGTPGHEGVGTIVESRSERYAVGDRVLVLQLGTYAEYMVAKETALVELPGDQPFDRMVMAQQLGVTLYAMERFWPDGKPGRVATIIGAGPIGLFFLQLARMWGFEHIVVSDPEPSRLAAAKKLGAAVTVQSSEQSVVEATHDISNGQGADLVIEAAGLDSARSQAIECVRTYGRIGYFGYPEAPGMAEFPYNTAFWKGPISIEFVINAQGVAGLPHFHKAVALIASGDIEVDYLLGQEFSLPEIDEAFKAARNRQFIKVQVVS